MSEWNYAEWAEKAGLENLKGRLATGDVLLAQANTLLSILLVGLGSGLAWVTKVLEAGPLNAVGASVVVATAWLAWVAAVLTWRCIATRATAVLYNEPGNLYQPALMLSETELRGFEMEGIQKRIDFTKRRNAQVAFWLDACRYAAISTPVWFALTFWAC